MTGRFDKSVYGRASFRAWLGIGLALAGAPALAQGGVQGPAEAELGRLQRESTLIADRISAARVAAEQERQARDTVARFEALRPGAEAAYQILGTPLAPSAPVPLSMAIVAPVAGATPVVPASSAGGVGAGSAPQLTGPEAIELTKEIEEENGKRNFGGVEFGVGISATFDIGTNDRISEAEVVAGLIRVKDSDNSRARIMFESHYFFTNPRPLLGQPADSIGIGPFMALQPGTNEIVEAVAGGVMVGLRRKGGSESFNVGIGLVIDPNTRTLGDDILANQPLPTGETMVRYKEQPQTGVVVLFSFGF